MRTLSFSILLLFQTFILHSQQTVLKGRVTDASTGEGLTGAHISVFIFP